MFTFCIDHFGMAREITNRTNSPKKVSEYEVNAIAIERGYIVHPKCCSEEVLNWLNNQTQNYNATFYQQWSNISSRNRLELLIDQLLHYASTYGTNMQGTPFVPNENFQRQIAVLNVPSIKELKLILPISDGELYEKCNQALCSGIALNSETLKDFIDYICFYADEYDMEPKVDSFKNRDAICIVSGRLGILPNDPVMALRTLIYMATKSTSFVQNSALIDRIKSGIPTDLSLLTEDEIKKFAAIFNRFKRIFLAFKSNNDINTTIINRISKLSKTLHQPMVKGFWESILEEEKSVNEIAANLKSLNNFKKVRLMQLVMDRLTPSKGQIYVIRNGKTFVRSDYTPNAVSENYCKMLYSMVRESLVESLRSKACAIKLPKNCELTLPSSEKTFVGNIPFGTSIKMTDHNIVGIYWRNEWGTHDFDLSFMDLNGYKIGWNSDYRNGNDVIYSGDMTNAEPEATELMYMSKEAPDAIVCVNRFNGCEGSKFRLFFAQEDLSERELRNYMVDPNSVKWDVMMKSDNAQQILGLICNNTFYMMDLQMGNSRVCYSRDYQKVFIETMKKHTACFVKLADILKDAGFTVINENANDTKKTIATADATTTNDDADNFIDFCDLKKDTIIKLMA